MSKIEVNKVILKIGKKKEVELSLDEARELQEVLADLLGVTTYTVTRGRFEYPVVTIPYPYPVPSPYRRWEVNPIWGGPFIGDSGDTAGTITISNSGTAVTEGSVP